MSLIFSTCSRDYNLLRLDPGSIVNSFHLNGNILFFKGYEGNFYASDLGNMGFGNPFPAFTPGYATVTVGVGKQVSLGETDLTLLNTSSSHTDIITADYTSSLLIHLMVLQVEELITT